MKQMYKNNSNTPLMTDQTCLHSLPHHDCKHSRASRVQTTISQLGLASFIRHERMWLKLIIPYLGEVEICSCHVIEIIYRTPRGKTIIFLHGLGCKTDLSTYTGDNPNKDILTCVTSVSCVAIVALTNVARHMVFTSTIYTRSWCTMIYNCEIMYKRRGFLLGFMSFIQTETRRHVRYIMCEKQKTNILGLLADWPVSRITNLAFIDGMSSCSIKNVEA